MSTLDEAINNLVDEQTLNMETMKRVQELKEKFTVLEEENERNKKGYDQYRKQVDADNELIRALKKQIEDWKEREHNLVERENLALRNELEKDKATAVGHTYRECYQFLLGNTVVREAIQKTIPVAVDGVNGCSGYVQHETVNNSTTKTTGNIKPDEGSEQ